MYNCVFVCTCLILCVCISARNSIQKGLHLASRLSLKSIGYPVRLVSPLVIMILTFIFSCILVKMWSKQNLNNNCYRNYFASFKIFLGEGYKGNVLNFYFILLLIFQNKKQCSLLFLSSSFHSFQTRRGKKISIVPHILISNFLFPPYFFPKQGVGEEH